jgi:hypothetical protein
VGGVENGGMVWSWVDWVVEERARDGKREALTCSKAETPRPPLPLRSRHFHPASSNSRVRACIRTSRRRRCPTSHPALSNCDRGLWERQIMWAEGGGGRGGR